MAKLIPTSTVPPLNSGDRLSRAAFEQVYRDRPDLKKAELIEGVVYVASPVRFELHGRPHYLLIAWLGIYESATPGVIGADNATVRLDFENEVQPDVLLRLPPERGGRSRVSPDDYLEGAPELIVEVAASSAAYDLHDKRRVYARNGVAEYLVLSAYEREVHWFALQDSVYTKLLPDGDGRLQSTVFPGLWLDPAALWRGDLATLLAVLQQGLASPEHAAFVAQMRDGTPG